MTIQDISTDLSWLDRITQNISIYQRVTIGTRCSTSLLFLFIYLIIFTPSSLAEWNFVKESNVYYTDDAALFSATRRLARLQDPTQPVIDRNLAEQGNDVVYEPVVQLSNSFSLMGRETVLGGRAQGFIFTDHSQFNHGSLGFQAAHDLTSSTRLILRYFYGPDLFLGKNEVRPIEEAGEDPPRLEDEEVTTHYWAGGFAQHLPALPEARLILYGRYGLREYDRPFTQRDTRFWTIGTHMEWLLTRTIGLALGYHYERGLADGRKQPELQDDISYYNHFVTGELEFEITQRVRMETALHYEFNGWTTGIEGDERKGEHENIVQGDIALQYLVNENFHVTAGLQAAHRKESFEEALFNLNTWVGVRLTF